jgi:hypothetical protein
MPPGYHPGVIGGDYDLYPGYPQPPGGLGYGLAPYPPAMFGGPAGAAFPPPGSPGRGMFGGAGGGLGRGGMGGLPRRDLEPYD